MKKLIVMLACFTLGYIVEYQHSESRKMKKELQELREFKDKVKAIQAAKSYKI